MASVGPSPSDPVGGESEPPTGVRMIIGGYDVHFPFKPYASQIGIASRVLKALDTGTNALLESPTGSGKSLALLCAAMAWQERWKASREAADSRGDAHDAQRHDRRAEAEPADRASKPSGGGKKEKVPRVYYATRTHSQIAQVVRELKRTSYRPAMTVLGSREHYCVNQKARTAAKKGGNLGEECKSLLESAGRRGRERAEERAEDDATDVENGAPNRSGGCGYSHGALKLAGKASKPGAEPVDIEDLVTLGQKTRGCPYFAAKHAHETAELVFCPYNYLLDPSVRAAMDVDIAGALVILDEAHNVEDTCREAASCDVHLHDLRAAAEEFERVAAAEEAEHTSAAGDGDGESLGAPEGHALLARVTGSVARWLHGASDQENPRCPLRPHGFERWMAVWSGGANVQRQLRDAGLAAETLPSIERARNAAVKAANDSSTPGALRVSGHALKTAEVLLSSARYALAEKKERGGSGSLGSTRADDFRLAVQKRFDEPVQGSSARFASDETRDETSAQNAAKVTLSLWCLNPALAFADIAGGFGVGPTGGTLNDAARSVVLVSGTLAPLDSFASELGAPFPIRMEAPHCVDVESQVWCGAVGVGFSGTRLSGTFKTSVEFSYQDDLGESLQKWCLEIPHGVLVFFPSYSLLDRVAQRWKSTGAWRRLEQATGKKLFQEPRGSGGGGGGGRGKGRGGRGGRSGGDKNADSLDALLSKYYRAVRLSVAAAPHAHAAAPVGSACRGGVLLAVCRGKVSEGIDFADANARGVVVVGIPYPNLKDKQVELKRKYNDEKHARAHRLAVSGVLSGDQWYSQQAFRALNQAVGRCLRHRNDHGAVLLVDERYAHGANGALVRNLPKWLRPATRKCADFDDSVTGLRAFFSLRAKHAPPEAAHARSRKPKLLPSVGADKDAKERDGGGGKPGGKPKESKDAAADAKQRDIKRFFQPATATAADATAAPAALETRAVRFEVEEERETRAEVTAPSQPAAPPVAKPAWKSAPTPAPHAPPVAAASQPPAPAPRWRSAPVPRVFEPARAAPDPLVTSQLTDPPSATHTQEVPETAPEVPSGAAPLCSFPPAPGPGSARAALPDVAAMELTEDIFAWGDDASSPGRSRRKSQGARDAGTLGENLSEDADPDELSVWGETPGTQGFGARGWGATQQFRNFAPAPEANAPFPDKDEKGLVEDPEADPEADPTPAPAFTPIPPPPRAAVPEKRRRAAEPSATTDASAGAPASRRLPARRPRGLGFGRVAVCRACGAKSVSTATALALPDAAEASATPARRVAFSTRNGDGTEGTRAGHLDGPAYLAALARANAMRDGTDENRSSSVVCRRARLFQPGEPFPLRCASEAPVRPDADDVNFPSRGKTSFPSRAASTSVPLPPPVTADDVIYGAWSRADGCYFVPLRCGVRWVGARVEATDGAASALVESAAVESDFRVSPPQTTKRRAALKPGAVFLLEDAILENASQDSRADGVLSPRAEGVLRQDASPRGDERGVANRTRGPESEDERDFGSDRENAPGPGPGPGPSAKRRRVRRKASAEAARAALLRERNERQDDVFEDRL